MATNKELNTELGAKIKSSRKQQGITREKLAESIDVSTRFLASVESGEAGLSLITLREVCRNLGLSADWLLGLEPEPDKTEQYNQLMSWLEKMDSRQHCCLLEIVKQIEMMNE